MNRYDLIDYLYNFITTTFNYGYWKSASKYNYSSTKFAQYNNYNDFCLVQEMVLNEKSNQELVFLVGIVNNINKIKFMNTNNMRPSEAYVIVFETDGSLVIHNEK